MPRMNDRQMTLGELIKALKRKNQETGVVYDFVYFVPELRAYSYRGYYEDLAIGYTNAGDAPTVAQLVEVLEKVNGETLYGYKGGEFTMTDDTAVWVAKSNESGGTAIVDVVEHDGQIVLKTEKID